MKSNTLALIFILFASSHAQHFSITPSTTLIGNLSNFVVQENSSFELLARDYEAGFDEVASANPTLHEGRILPGTAVLIPSQYILPKRNPPEIVVNLPEKRLYYFPDKHNVYTYPIGIGRVNWNSPKGTFRISQKQKNPTWYVPRATREEEALKGNFLPKTLPPGPDNPLGKYKMRLSGSTYLIHGTNRPDTIGKRSTSGCISLYPEDIDDLYTRVKLGTRVKIINKPLKMHIENGNIILESHHPLKYTLNDELIDMTLEDVKEEFNYLQKVIPKDILTNIDPNYMMLVLTESLGIPQPLVH